MPQRAQFPSYLINSDAPLVNSHCRLFYCHNMKPLCCICRPPSKVLVSGAEVKLTDASNPGSVKQFHDKPQPKVEKPVKHHHQHAIQQPRKQ